MTKTLHRKTAKKIVAKAKKLSVKRIGLVGHCFMDGPGLKDVIEKRYPGCEAVRFGSREALTAECLRGDDQLLLVNHMPTDPDLNPWGVTGIEVIRDVLKNHPKQRCLLVTGDKEDAEKATAIDGTHSFSKDQVWDNDPNWVKTFEAALK